MNPNLLEAESAASVARPPGTGPSIKAPSPANPEQGVGAALDEAKETIKDACANLKEGAQDALESAKQAGASFLTEQKGTHEL